MSPFVKTTIASFILICISACASTNPSNEKITEQALLEIDPEKILTSSESRINNNWALIEQLKQIGKAPVSNPAAYHLVPVLGMKNLSPEQVEKIAREGNDGLPPHPQAHASVTPSNPLAVIEPVENKVPDSFVANKQIQSSLKLEQGWQPQAVKAMIEISQPESNKVENLDKGVVKTEVINHTNEAINHTKNEQVKDKQDAYVSNAEEKKEKIAALSRPPELPKEPPKPQGRFPYSAKEMQKEMNMARLIALPVRIQNEIDVIQAVRLIAEHAQFKFEIKGKIDPIMLKTIRPFEGNGLSALMSMGEVLGDKMNINIDAVNGKISISTIKKQSKKKKK